MDYQASQETKRIAPTRDVMFSCIFRDMGAAQAMLSLINAMRIDKGKEPLAEIIDIHSQYNLIGKTINDKISRLDVNAKSIDGTMINIEMQIANMPGMDKRIAFYSANLLTALDVGDDYAKLPSLNMVVIEGKGHKVNGDEQYHHSFSMRDDSPPHNPLPGWAEVHKLSLPTFERTENYDKNNLLNWWMKMLTDGYLDPKFIEEASKMDVGLQQFAQRYNLALDDPELKRKVAYYESAERDYIWKMNAYKKIGLEEGKAEGMAVGKAEGMAVGKAEGMAEERSKLVASAARFLASDIHKVTDVQLIFPDLSIDELRTALEQAKQLRNNDTLANEQNGVEQE